MQIGLNTQVVEYSKACYFAPSLNLFFPISQEPHAEAYLEHEYWPKIMPELSECGDMPDFTNPKIVGEFLASGCFYAPDAKPVTHGEAKITLGEQSKSVLISGNRTWDNRNNLEPMTRMPISYANAYGGEAYPLNPKGKGYKQDNMPNIELPGKVIMDQKSEKIIPAGFSPVDMMSPERLKYMGTYDDKWMKQGGHGYPDDFDWHYFNSAAKDQWLKDGYFAGTEDFLIYNMHPQKKLLSGVLPGVKGRCFVKVKDNSRLKEIELRLDTVCFFPAAECFQLVYRGWAKVQDDEATEITDILAAYENLDENRSADYYQDAFDVRVNSATEKRYSFHTQALIPTDATCGFVKLFKDAKDSNPNSARKKMMDVKRQSLQKKADDIIDKEREKYEVAGLDFDEALASQANPDFSADYDGMDLLPEDIESGKQKQEMVKNFMGWQQDFADDSKKQADKIKKIIGKDGEDVNPHRIHEIFDAMDESGIASEKLLEDKRFKHILDYQKSQPIEPIIRPQIEVCVMAFDERQAWQNSDPDQPDISDEELQEQKDKLKDRMSYAHYMGAHLHDFGTSPHEESLDVLRQRVLDEYAIGNSLVDSDYACIDLSNQNLQGIDFSGAWLEQINFSGADLSGANFSKAILAKADFSGANLTDANLEEANIGKANFFQANLTRTNCNKGIIQGANFTETICHHAIFTDMQFAIEMVMQKSDFSNAELKGWSFIEQDLTGCVFIGAKLHGIDFIQCQLENIDFSAMSAHSINIIDCNLSKTNFSHADIGIIALLGKESQCNQIDFSHARVKTFNGRNQNLANSNFSQIYAETYFDLTSANISNCNFNQAFLPNSRFDKAIIDGADFSGSHLQQSSFRKAQIKDSLFVHINGYRADFRGSTREKLMMDDANLDMALF